MHIITKPKKLYLESHSHHIKQFKLAMAKHGRLPNKCDPQTQSKVDGHDWLCTVTLFLNTYTAHTQKSGSTLYSHWLPPAKKLIVETANKTDFSDQHTAKKMHCNVQTRLPFLNHRCTPLNITTELINLKGNHCFWFESMYHFAPGGNST